MLRALKSFLPKGSRIRRLPFGLARGAVMPIDFGHQTRLYLGLYERELRPHFRRLLQPGMRAFDVGCADGYCALLIHRLTGAEVVGFEAGDISQLNATLASNSPKLAAVRAFVGSELSLDEAAERFFFPDFIKIDVEGAEGAVLDGARNILARGPSLIIEVHSKAAEASCLMILGEHDYVIETVDQAALFREHRPLAHNRWLVCHR